MGRGSYSEEVEKVITSNGTFIEIGLDFNQDGLHSDHRYHRHSGSDATFLFFSFFLIVRASVRYRKNSDNARHGTNYCIKLFSVRKRREFFLIKPITFTSELQHTPHLLSRSRSHI